MRRECTIEIGHQEDGRNGNGKEHFKFFAFEFATEDEIVEQEGLAGFCFFLVFDDG